MLTRRRVHCFLVAGLLSVWLASPGFALAHVGAPYPVLLEQPVGPYTASALADPDVGTGTFYVLVDLADGQSIPPGTSVTVWAEPEDGHQAAAGHPAQREETRYGERFVARVPFDAEGPWQVRLVMDGPAGAGETSFTVRVTPSGIGWLASVACLIPFVVLGALWLRGALRQRSNG
ncbi:MAG: hypothetical protein ACK2UC_13050 [Anaerolineae bacterium]